jgi:hypothetical protein
MYKYDAMATAPRIARVRIKSNINQFTKYVNQLLVRHLARIPLSATALCSSQSIHTVPLASCSAD